VQAASNQETADAVAESMVSTSSFSHDSLQPKVGQCIFMCYSADVCTGSLEHCMSDLNCDKQESAAQTRLAKEETAGVQQALDAAKV